MRIAHHLLLQLSVLVISAGAATGQSFSYRPLPVGSSLAGSKSQDALLFRTRPDEHAPIGVLGERREESGEWTFSYRYSRYYRSGLANGKGDVTEADAFAEGYTSVPRRFAREEHLLSALYGVTEGLSLLMTLPWINKEMSLVSPDTPEAELRSTGLGDVRVTGLYGLWESESSEFNLDIGVSLPTGSRDERQPIPGGDGTSIKLPYDMQLSSGTVDVIPGISFTQREEITSWGLQAKQTLRHEKNSDGYKLGNETNISTWVSRRLRENIAGSLRCAYEHKSKITGRDPQIDANLSPAHDPRRHGGDMISIFGGVHYTKPGGHTFSAEVGGPIWKDLNGPQLELDIVYVLGWRLSF